MNDARFIYIADVFCPWCYGFAPIMKRIADEHKDIPTSVLGGNLVSKPITLEQDYAAQPGLVDFWHEVEKTVNRPLSGAINAALENRDILLYSPGADEILTVLAKAAPGHELEQFFMLEDLFYADGKNLFAKATLADIAKRWNLQPEAFLNALNQPGAFEATEANLQKAAETLGEITSYPSLFLARGNRIDAVSRGYVPYATVAARVTSAMKDLDLEPAPAQVCSRHGGCSLHAR